MIIIGTLNSCQQINKGIPILFTYRMLVDNCYIIIIHIQTVISNKQHEIRGAYYVAKNALPSHSWNNKKMFHNSFHWMCTFSKGINQNMLPKFRSSRLF